jgi:hypothetical protein
MQEKAADFVAFGTEHFWIFDPMRREAWSAGGGELHMVETRELAVPETAIRVVLAVVWAELDRV